MPRDEPDARHLSNNGFQEYLAAGIPAVIRIEGMPVLFLSIEPSLRRLGLRAPLTYGNAPDLTAYRNLSAATVHWQDKAWRELRVQDMPMADAYTVLCSIADRIQLAGQPFAAAVVDALTSFRSLFAGSDRLSEQQETGLFGELLVLKHLLRSTTEAVAVGSWRGPAGEEHDFDLDGDDAEIKTTAAEARAHWISDLRQLQPTTGRRLWLLSVQLTGAGAGGSTLPELISGIASAIRDPAALEAFHLKLRAVRWTDDAAELYTRRLRLRSLPCVFAVDGSFPSLTADRLAAVGVDHSRISRVTYVVNLDGMTPAADPPALLRNLDSEMLP